MQRNQVSSMTSSSLIEIQARNNRMQQQVTKSTSGSMQQMTSPPKVVRQSSQLSFGKQQTTRGPLHAANYLSNTLTQDASY